MKTEHFSYEFYAQAERRAHRLRSEAITSFLSTIVRAVSRRKA
ncbi:RSP_7527 family protein [Stappia sediminis]|nr:hypothetical protein [Stappia sediminis]